jgi:pilus assembly protein CpaE
MADTKQEDWKVPDIDDERTFALEEDPTFGAGDLEGAPPTEDADSSWTAIAAEAFEAAGRSGGDQPIPRVTINAFCDRPDVATAIEAAAGDRRLAKAIVHVSTGGIEAALTSLASQASPNLIIIDTTAPASALLRGLDRLAQIVDEGTKVVIVGAANDIALYRELMRRGVSEYMIAPVQPLQVIQSISALYVNPDKPFVGRIAAVLGAKGGVGASTLAHNLAWCIAERYGANSTLMDLDLPFGTVGLDFNQDQTQGVAEALLAPERVDEVFLDRLLTRQTERLTLFTAPATLEREFELDPTAYEMVIDRVRRAVPFVLLDLVHAARPHDAPPTIALNMVGVPKRPEIPVKDFGEALGTIPGFVVPFEPAIFGAAATNGQMVVEMAPESRSGLAIDQLAQALCGREPVAPKKTSMLDRIPALLKR